MGKFDMLNITDEEDILHLIEGQDSCYFNLFENPSEKLKLKSLMANPYCIRLITDATEEMQIIAVRKQPYVITHISNPSEEVQLAAIVASDFDIRAILCCPDWRKLKEKIIDMATIKDIIE